MAVGSPTGDGDNSHMSFAAMLELCGEDCTSGREQEQVKRKITDHRYQLVQLPAAPITKAGQACTLARVRNQGDQNAAFVRAKFGRSACGVFKLFSGSRPSHSRNCDGSTTFSASRSTGLPVRQD